MMFSESCNDRRPPIAAGIGNNSAEIGDDAAGIVPSKTPNVIPSKTPSLMETGVTLFLEDKFQRGVPGRQFPKGSTRSS